MEAAVSFRTTTEGCVLSTHVTVVLQKKRGFLTAVFNTLCGLAEIGSDLNIFCKKIFCLLIFFYQGQAKVSRGLLAYMKL